MSESPAGNNETIDYSPLPVSETGASDPTVSPQQTVSSTPAIAPPDSSLLNLETLEQVTVNGKAPAAGDVPLPETVAGYEILGLLGRGGMGVVYQARQQGLKRLVALKMILAGGHASSRALARFRSEAEAVAQIQHPHIIQIFEVGEEAGLPFFSLEYVEGGSLAGKIASTPQKPREAAQLVQLLAQAMECAHQKGIVHRDLKPANILLTLDGSPKITDFGLAKQITDDSAKTRSGTILGTPSYMAPEQAEGRAHEVGPLADVYSLGAILYELLTGRPPFQGITLLETIQQVQTQEPVAPTQLQPGVPADLETICLKCLRKEPGQRYASAADLAEDLRRFLAGEPIRARPVGRVERLWRWSKRNPRVALLSGTVAVLVVVWAMTASVLVWRLNLQQQATAEQAAIARENEAKANTNAAEAKSRYQKAAASMIDLTERAQNRLRSKRMAARSLPEVQQLREDLLKQFRQSLAQMAQELEKAEATPFATVGTAQKLGDLLSRLGQHKEALEQYQLGYRLARQVAEEQPENDLARANLGVMVLRLGHAALDLEGDGRAARDYYRRARELHQDVADHPRSSNYTEVDLKRILSHDEMPLGKVELYLGDPAAACRHFQEALALRTFWSEAEPQSSEARSYVMEARMWLGVARSHLDEPATMREQFEEALRIGKALAQKHPKDVSFKADLAEVYEFQGDAEFIQGKLETARKCYQQSLQELEPVLAQKPDSITYDPLLARTYERLAALQLRQGQPTEAQANYRKALQVREDLLRIERNNPTWQAAYLLALAHCGKHAEAVQGAQKLRQGVARSTELLLQLARCCAVSAAAAPDAAQKQRYVETALEAATAATKDGYKDVVVLRRDPDLESLRQTAGFQTLLTHLQER